VIRKGKRRPYLIQKRRTNFTGLSALEWRKEVEEEKGRREGKKVPRLEKNRNKVARSKSHPQLIVGRGGGRGRSVPYFSKRRKRRIG